MSVFVFFPRLYRKDAIATNFLTEERIEWWVDEVLLHTIRRSTEDGYLQHLPPNYRSAKLAAQAAHLEGHS